MNTSTVYTKYNIVVIRNNNNNDDDTQKFKNQLDAYLDINRRNYLIEEFKKINKFKMCFEINQTIVSKNNHILKTKFLLKFIFKQAFTLESFI